MKKTSLFKQHQIRNAKWIDFHGWNMPLSYGNIKEEYHCVRSNAGLFDVSHMGIIHIRSNLKKSSFDLLEFLTCRKIPVKEGNAQYNALVQEDGGTLDDIILYCMGTDHYMLIVNAARVKKVMEHLIYWNQKKNLICQISEEKDHVLLSLQGPASENILKSALGEDYFFLLDFYYYEFKKMSSPKILFSRTGYTGEDGFELLMPSTLGNEIWNRLIEKGALPCGLAARDILRLEIFYPLYGNELSEDKSILTSGIEWLVHFDKYFLGKKSLEEQIKNIPSKTIGFMMQEKGIPRKGYRIFSDSKEVGYVTSGGFSFQWEKGIGMAYLDAKYAHPDTDLFIRIRDQKKKIKIFLKSPYKGSIKKKIQ